MVSLAEQKEYKKGYYDLINPSKNKIEKNRLRALKAWETMRKRGFHKYKKRPEEQKYNNPKKNNVRNKIIKLIKKYGGKNVLTLETTNFMLPLSLKKYEFFICEENEEEYLKMIKNKPKNVFLYYGNISQMCSLVKDFEVIYLDFCCGYENAMKVINKLKEKIYCSKLVGFTFCLRKNKKSFSEDYTLDLIFKLQEFLGSSFIPVYKESYADSSPMATLFFMNKDLKEVKEKTQKEEEEEEEEEISLDCRDRIKITKWAIKKMNKFFPHIHTPHQIFDGNAKTHYIKTKFGDIIIERLFNLAMKEKVLRFPLQNQEVYRYGYKKKYDSLDYKGMYQYFLEVLFFSIFNMWKKQDKNWRCYDINWENFANGGDDLFLIDKEIKPKKCFLCDNKEGVIEFKEKFFCTSCFIHHICGDSFFGVDDKKEKPEVEIINKEGYFPKYSNGEYYHGSNICASCKKKLYNEGINVSKTGIEIINFRCNTYCKECFFNVIKPKIEEIKKMREDYEECKRKKILEVYGLKEIKQK